jgi:hypothetical protein
MTRLLKAHLRPSKAVFWVAGLWVKILMEGNRLKKYDKIGKNATFFWFIVMSKSDIFED